MISVLGLVPGRLPFYYPSGAIQPFLWRCVARPDMILLSGNHHYR